MIDQFHHWGMVKFTDLDVCLLFVFDQAGSTLGRSVVS